MRETRDIRLFFALWPDRGVRKAISDCLKAFPSYGGRVVPQYNWHMTLHFVGNTTYEEKTCLDRQARKLRAEPFELILDQSGYFKKPRVFWLGCQQPPSVLFDLQKKLGDEISHCDYQPETRPYSPHITVARKVVEKPELTLVDRIYWRIDRFVLIESVAEQGGVRYRVIEQYPLA